MKVGILKTGRPPRPAIPQFGTYPDMFMELLGREAYAGNTDNDCNTSRHAQTLYKALSYKRAGWQDGHQYVLRASMPVLRICISEPQR